MGCLSLGHLFTSVSFIITGNLLTGFNVGLLGTFGCYLFLFSASFGQMDSLVDGKEKQFRKYRCAALIPVVLIAACFLLILFSPAELESKIVYGVFYVMFMLTSYYNLKHILLPDVDYGILKSIRSYNALILVFTLFNVSQTIFASYNMNFYETIFSFAQAVVCVWLIPVLERGIKKWTM